jgi:hypothetical protein
MKVSGISTGFPVLSRSSGQVPHVLLTRSPLSTRASPGFSFDLHVLGAPPAFVLSQDQTLHRDLRPSPGLAGGVIDQRVAETGSLSRSRQRLHGGPSEVSLGRVSPCGIDVNVSAGLPREIEPHARTGFWRHYSVFKEPRARQAADDWQPQSAERTRTARRRWPCSPEGCGQRAVVVSRSLSAGGSGRAETVCRADWP